MSRVLNRLVYQKAGWVLHMLRGTIGTDTFWTGIRDYYRRYRNQNASTDDFRQVMEQASGTSLSWFFDQWLTRPGMPSLARRVALRCRRQAGADRDRAGPERRRISGFRSRSPSPARPGQPRIERVELTAGHRSVHVCG